LSEARRIKRISEQFGVVADAVFAERNKFFAFAEFVEVECNFFRAVERAFFATVNRILFAFFVTRVIKIFAVINSVQTQNCSANAQI